MFVPGTLVHPFVLWLQPLLADSALNLLNLLQIVHWLWETDCAKNCLSQGNPRSWMAASVFSFLMINKLLSKADTPLSPAMKTVQEFAWFLAITHTISQACTWGSFMRLQDVILSQTCVGTRKVTNNFLEVYTSPSLFLPPVELLCIYTAHFMIIFWKLKTKGVWVVCVCFALPFWNGVSLHSLEWPRTHHIA